MAGTCNLRCIVRHIVLPQFSQTWRSISRTGSAITESGHGLGFGAISVQQSSFSFSSPFLKFLNLHSLILLPKDA